MDRDSGSGEFHDSHAPRTMRNSAGFRFSPHTDSGSIDNTVRAILATCSTGTKCQYSQSTNRILVRTITAVCNTVPVVEFRVAWTTGPPCRPEQCSASTPNQSGEKCLVECIEIPILNPHQLITEGEAPIGIASAAAVDRDRSALSRAAGGPLGLVPVVVVLVVPDEAVRRLRRR